MPEIEFKSLDEDAVLKEVWNTDHVKAKTELEDRHIESINKLGTLSILFNSDLLKDHLEDFMVLQKSRQRKSMGEFVAVVKAKRDDVLEKGGSFFRNMMG